MVKPAENLYTIRLESAPEDFDAPVEDFRAMVASIGFSDQPSSPASASANP